MNLLELKNVSLAYEENLILRDVNLSIKDQEFVGILGPNGSGKTTLLKLMIGVLKPREGSVYLKGKDLATYPRQDIAKMISVLPQETIVDFPFTALEVVLMGRSPYLKRFGWETAHDLEIARQVMEQTDTWEFAPRDIRSLSGGERERVLLARALAQEPEILLLDEPTTHLDLKHQWEIYRLLRKLNREKGLTLVVVLHDLNFASQACSRVILLSEAKVHSEGPPREILTPELIQEVYGIPLANLSHPTSEKPFFFPELG